MTAADRPQRRGAIGWRSCRPSTKEKAEQVRQETAPDSAQPQLTREEAADRSKARDTAARAQFAQRIEGGAEVAQVSPGDRAKKAKAVVDQIAAAPSKAADNAIEVGLKLDQLSRDIGRMELDVLSPDSVARSGHVPRTGRHNLCRIGQLVDGPQLHIIGLWGSKSQPAVGASRQRERNRRSNASHRGT
jgi:hypothetical protein